MIQQIERNRISKRRLNKNSLNKRRGNVSIMIILVLFIASISAIAMSPKYEIDLKQKTKDFIKYATPPARHAFYGNDDLGREARTFEKSVALTAIKATFPVATAGLDMRDMEKIRFAKDLHRRLNDPLVTEPSTLKSSGEEKYLVKSKRFHAEITNIFMNGKISIFTNKEK